MVFWKNVRFGFPRNCQHGHTVVVHVIAPHLVRAVGKTIGVLFVGRHEQKLRGIGGAAGDYDNIPAKCLHFPIAFHHLFLYRTAASVCGELQDLRIPQQSYIRKLESQTHAEHFGVGFGMNQAGKPIAGLTANTFAVGHVLFIEHDMDVVFRFASRIIVMISIFRPMLILRWAIRRRLRPSPESDRQGSATAV